MRVIDVGPVQVREAGEILARAMLDDAAGVYLLPDPAERLAYNRVAYTALVTRALDEGWVHACGDPIAGVAAWLRRPPVDAPLVPPDPRPPGAPSPLPVDAVRRLERLHAVLRRLREIARPDEHAYLDSIGVLPGHRRRGIATCLIEAGHAWAHDAGLPCALEALTADNVAFYGRRGYAVVATMPLPGSGLTVTSMRRVAAPPVVPRPGSRA